jgi:hypothetical protein
MIATYNRQNTFLVQATEVLNNIKGTTTSLSSLQRRRKKFYDIWHQAFCDVECQGK